MAEIVWYATDSKGQFRAEVVRSGRYAGTFRIVRLTDDVIVESDEVTLAYDARFGPDVQDAAEWLVKAEEAVARHAH